LEYLFIDKVLLVPVRRASMVEPVQMKGKHSPAPVRMDSQVTAAKQEVNII
jgi:hypothetical protein